MYKTDLRILRFTVITITSGRVLKRMVAKFISITRINKKILVKSEVDNPSTRDTGENRWFCLLWKTGGLGKERAISLILAHSFKTDLLKDY